MTTSSVPAPGAHSTPRRPTPPNPIVEQLRWLGRMLLFSIEVVVSIPATLVAPHPRGSAA